MHRAGHVDQEHQIGRRQLLDAAIRGLDGDTQQARLRVPRRHRQLGADAEGHIPLRQRVVVGKVVDQLFQAHGVLRWQLPAVEEAPHIGIAACIDVDAEGRHRRLGDGEHRVVGISLVLLARLVTVAWRQGIGDGCWGVGHRRHAFVTRLGSCGRGHAFTQQRGRRRHAGLGLRFRTRGTAGGEQQQGTSRETGGERTNE